MKAINIFMVAVVALMLTSCYTTRTAVGNYTVMVKVDKAQSYTYAKGKQVHIFWGIIPVGRTQVATPIDGNCQIKTQRRFIDAFVTALTGGIVSIQTITVRAPIVHKE